MPTASKRAASKPLVAPEPVPVNPGIELWRNATAGVVVVSRTGEYGRRLHESVTGGRVFQVTPQERRNMQNAAATDDLDMFTNGSLQPVSLLADELDTAELLANPNLLEEDDIPKLLRLHDAAFAERVAAIDQIMAVNRLLEIARNPRYKMTVAQYEVVKRRERALKALKEGLIEPEGVDTGEDTPRPVTPN